MLAQTPATQTDSSRGLPQSLPQANGILPPIRSKLLPFTSFPIHQQRSIIGYTTLVVTHNTQKKRDANNYWHHVQHVPGTKDVQHITGTWSVSSLLRVKIVHLVDRSDLFKISNLVYDGREIVRSLYSCLQGQTVLWWGIVN